jgi:hypothetical protein
VTSSRAAGDKRQPAGRFLGIALQGAALFLFIPLVLFLFLRQPLGPGWSVALGVVIMLGHRFLAAPWMAKFADVRCLWCGRVGHARHFTVRAGGRTWTMSACSEAHEAGVASFLRFVQRFRLPIAAGIFLPLVWLLVAAAAAAAGRPLSPHDTNALIFRVLVAATVVTSSVVPFVASRPADTDDRALRCPFPLHNLFLLGVGNTLWVFRLVGAWWLVDAALRLRP